MSDTDGDAPRGIEVARITIVKTFDDEIEGSASGIWTTYSDGLQLADALGMLAFSQATAFADFASDGPEEGT